MKYILHIDMNSFYASCHISENPKYQGKPVVVSNASRRSVILTASYEARKYGVTAAMPLFIAERKCDNLIVVPPNFDLYKKYSNYFFDIIKHHSDQYFAGSIDEAYLDVTETQKKHGGVIKLAKKIQKDLLDRYNLPCSIGISYTKFLAKMASDMKKPLGITIVGPKDIETKIWTLPIEATFGIGKRTSPQLRSIGINTIGDLAKFKRVDILKEILKNGYDDVISKIYGKSSDVVETVDFDSLKQIGNSSTFNQDIYEEEIIYKRLLEMVKKVHGRMIRRRVLSKTFSIQLRYTNFKTINRSMTLSEPSDDLDLLKSITRSLFDKHWNGDPIRHVGFSTGALVDKSSSYKQLNLFNYQDETVTDLDKAVIELKNKYDDNVIFKASNLKNK